MADPLLELKKLSVKSKNICWNDILTQEEKAKLVFMGQCGKCECYHEFPKCRNCYSIRRRKGQCEVCMGINLEEDVYISACGNCYKWHELPNCVECQYYRVKPGNCTNCGAIGPDDSDDDEDYSKWSCIRDDKDYEELLKPVFPESQKRMNAMKFEVHTKCLLCPGYFHSIKACMFRKHAKFIIDLGVMMEKNISLFEKHVQFLDNVEEIIQKETQAGITLPICKILPDLKDDLKQHLPAVMKDLAKELGELYTTLIDDNRAQFAEDFN